MGRRSSRVHAQSTLTNQHTSSGLTPQGETKPLLLHSSLVMCTIKSNPRWLLLALLLFAAIGNQMNRFLFPFLSSVTPDGCADECDHKHFVPVCFNCTESQCAKCQACKQANHFAHYNMQDGTCVTTQQYGTLAGITFASVYAFSSLFAGYIVDDRRHFTPLTIARVSMCVWVVAGALQSRASSFNHMVGLRMLLGFSEAFLNPAAFALIADAFAHGERATPNAVYSWGVYCGYGVASLSIPAALTFGWRDTCIFFNIPVAACLILLFAVRDYTQTPTTKSHFSRTTVVSAQTSTVGPGGGMANQNGQVNDSVDDGDDFGNDNNHGEHDTDRLAVRPRAEHEYDDIAGTSAVVDQQESENQAIAPMRTRIWQLVTMPTFFWLLMGTCMRQMVGFTLAEYMPIYFHRRYPHMQTTFAVSNAAAVVFVGVISSFCGGYVCDFCTKRGTVGAGVLVAISFATACPCAVVSLLTPKFGASFAFWSLALLFGEAWLGPVVSVIQLVAPLHSRGLAVALFSSCSLVGNIAPTVVGLLDPGDDDLGVVLVVVVGCAYLLSAAAFLMMAVFIARMSSNSLDVAEG